MFAKFILNSLILLYVFMPSLYTRYAFDKAVHELSMPSYYEVHIILGISFDETVLLYFQELALINPVPGEPVFALKSYIFFPFGL